MPGFLRIINRLMTLTLLMAVLGFGLLYFLRVQLDQPGPLDKEALVVIPQGKGAGAIAEQLEQAGVIEDRRVFVTMVIYFSHLRYKSTLKAGEYEFAPHVSMREVLDTLVEGKTIRHKVTVAEGLTSMQVVEKLLQQPDLSGEIASVPAEGTLLPDTYLFARGDTRQEILDRMHQAQVDFLNAAWERRAPDLAVQTPEQALILASIVEKETGIEGERPKIAAVFENRLKKHMRLQSDPTIIYGLAGGKGSLGRPILQSELAKKTAYNTYQIDGLPPTPIANPGRKAIEAVLQPAQSDALYFVADGSGGHAFAATLEEHNKNVAAWRKFVKDQREADKLAAQAAGDGAASTDLPEDAGALVGVGEADTDTPPGTGEPPVPVRNPKLDAQP